MIKLPAYFLGFSSKTDGSAGLRFGTQELLAEDFAELKRNQNNFGWLLFKENEITVDDLPEEDPEEEGKSQSERIRAVLFVYWKQQGSKGNFQNFYKAATDKYIDSIKAKLK